MTWVVFWAVAMNLGAVAILGVQVHLNRKFQVMIADADERRAAFIEDGNRRAAQLAQMRADAEAYEAIAVRLSKGSRHV